MCSSSQAILLKRPGFTLAELLISLAILGVIATFTVPKILSTQQNSAKVAEAKEVAAMISEAYQKAQTDGRITSNTYSRDLIPYLNYLKLDTSGTVIDTIPGYSTINCNGTTRCILLCITAASFGSTIPILVALPT